MDLKHFLSRFLSTTLIGTGLYQIFYSVGLLIFVYPKLEVGNDFMGLVIQESLIEKAIIYWLLIVVQGIYGFLLLFKSKEETKVFHLIAGAAISVFAIFFVVRTSLTLDPLSASLINRYFRFFRGFLK